MKIRKIEARSYPIGTIKRVLKVACYVRVSTLSDEQNTSYEAQIDYYTKKIGDNPDWKFVGAYCDRGISGTSSQNREAFNEMINDALAGKIDLILTKSISRFARNTVDSIETIRMLRDKNVTVYFEKEDIRTDDAKGEFLITLLSSFAQEESRNMSENVKWGFRRKYEKGEYSINFSWFLGYKRGENGNFEIDEEQAKIVRRIYDMALQGLSACTIVKRLETDEIVAPGGGKKWYYSTVKSILSNEKYKGDALLQKYYTLDYLSHKQVENKGEIEQFYVKGGHEAIIDEEVWEYVQKLQITTKKQRPFARKIICGECGSFYGSRPWHSTTYNYLVWQCASQVKGKCNGKRLYDISIQMVLDELLPVMCETLMEKIYRLFEAENVREETEKLIKEKVLFSNIEEWAIIIENIVVSKEVLDINFIDGRVEQVPFPQGTPCCPEWSGWSGKEKSKTRRKKSSAKKRVPKKTSSKKEYKDIGICQCCGVEVKQNPGRKEKKFCSDKCRNAWWNSNLDKVNRRAYYKIKCKNCKKKFTVYGSQNRKYCCHECYVKDKFGREA